jgi:hypothetical protein
VILAGICLGYWFVKSGVNCAGLNSQLRVGRAAKSIIGCVSFELGFTTLATGNISVVEASSPFNPPA